MKETPARSGRHHHLEPVSSVLHGHADAGGDGQDALAGDPQDVQGPGLPERGRRSPMARSASSACRDGEQTSKRILQVARAIEVVFLVAVIVLLIASVMLIANTIRLSIFARRREIEVMKLVGRDELVRARPVHDRRASLRRHRRAGGRASAPPRQGARAARDPRRTTSTPRGDVQALGFGLMALILLGRRSRRRRARLGDDAATLPARLTRRRRCQADVDEPGRRSGPAARSATRARATPTGAQR